MLFGVGRIGRQTVTLPRVLTDTGIYTSPTLDLDLTSALDSRIVFTRAAGPATYFDGSGVLQTAGTNVPRFEYDPQTLAPRGLLVEDTRTNSLLNSGTLSGLGGVNCSRAGNAIVAPDGTLTASSFTIDSTSNPHYGNQIVGAGVITTNQPWTASVFVKPDTQTKFALHLFDNTTASNTLYAEFDLTGAGSVHGTSVGGVATGISAAIALAGGGWYRISLTGTLSVAADTGIIFRLRFLDGNYNPVYLGNGTDKFYAWGAQLEAGAFISSYVPTTAAAVTRAADSPTMPVGPWFNAAQGSLTAEGYFRTIATTQNTEFVGLGLSSADLYRLMIGSGQSAMSLQAFAASVNQYNATAAGVIAANVLAKAGMAYNLTGLVVKHVTNGGVVTSGVATSAMPGTPTTLYIGGAGRGFLMYGTTSRIRYWPRALTDTDLAAATL